MTFAVHEELIGPASGRAVDTRDSPVFNCLQARFLNAVLQIVEREAQRWIEVLQ